MFFLYDLFLRLALTLLRLLSFFHPRLKLMFRIRSLSPIGEQFPENVYWFHAASVGEYEQARAVAVELKRRKPEAKILFTVFSDSAYTQRQDDSLPDFFYALPFDRANVMRGWLQAIRPKAIFYARYDVWPNLAREAFRSQVPQYLISASLKKNSSRWNGFLGKFHRKVYSFLTLIFTVSESDEVFFRALGFAAKQTGDTRFDAALEKVKNQPESVARKKDTIRKIFRESSPLLIGGSTYRRSEVMLLEWAARTGNHLILVPHHVDESHISDIEKFCSQRELSFIRLSRLSKPQTVNVLIVDSTGILPFLYELGDVAYVGGGFEGSVHSLLEPIVSLKPVIAGPAVGNAPEADELMKKGFLRLVPTDSAKEFDSVVRQVLREGIDRGQMEVFLKSNLGSAGRILDSVKI